MSLINKPSISPKINPNTNSDLKASKVFLALDSLFTRYINLYSSDEKQLPAMDFESDWESPCVIHNEENKIVYWRPTERYDYTLFKELESALEIKFHDDIKHFYGSFWSNGICVEREDINFMLIQLWNSEDQTHLQENLLGHAFAKIKARLPLSFFIGCTHGEDIICLEQESGHIVLEKPGRTAHKVLAESLELFLLSLEPTKDTYDK